MDEEVHLGTGLLGWARFLKTSFFPLGQVLYSSFLEMNDRAHPFGFNKN